MGSFHERGGNGMGQDKGPPWTKSSQPATQAKTSPECFCNAALSAHARAGPLKGHRTQENNIDPIYILLGNKPTEI